MIEFFIALTSVLLVYVGKIFFLKIESEYLFSTIGILEITVFTTFIVVGIYFYFKDGDYRNITTKQASLKINKKTLSIILFSLGMWAILFSFFLNFSKKSIHWDAIALYDARAKFLANGMKFSQMTSFGQYDTVNKYYYLIYPPFTSVVHFFWNSNVVTSKIPVGVYYSITLLVMSVFLFYITKREMGILPAIIMFFLVSTNGSIFNVTIKEYTNLPYDLYLVSGIFLLYTFIRKKIRWMLIFGILLITSTIWIRLLESIWIAVGIAFLLSFVVKKFELKKFYAPLILLSVCFLEYSSWQYFVKSISDNPGFLKFSYVTMLSPIAGVFTGAPIVVLVTIAKAWGLPFFVHFLAVTAAAMKWRTILKDKALLFLVLTVFLSILLYFAQFYMLAFQHDWWNIVAASLDRSSSFLIPISAYILLKIVFTSDFLPSRK
jgi:hypothetical protein